MRKGAEVRIFHIGPAVLHLANAVFGHVVVYFAAAAPRAIDVLDSSGHIGFLSSSDNSDQHTSRR